MINLFKSSEPDTIPVFVARQLDKLPPILIDHLDCSKLLKDMSKLRTEIEMMKSNFATLDKLNELRDAVLCIQNDSLPPPTSAFKVNKKRGAWCDSGPMGLSHDLNVQESESCMDNNEMMCTKPPLTQYREMEVVQNKQSERDLNRCQRMSSAERGEISAGAGCGEGGVHLQARMSPAPLSMLSVPPPCRDEPSAATGLVASAAVTSHAPSHTQGASQLIATDKAGCNRELQEHVLPVRETKPDESNNDSERWQTVHRRKTTKYRYSGKSGVARDLECTFRAAERKIPMFITNVHMSTAESDIVKHILHKTQETVYLERINMKYERGHKAYKFLISEENLSKYLDESLWPAGVIFRRFVNYKYRKTNGTHILEGDGLNKPKHA